MKTDRTALLAEYPPGGGSTPRAEEHLRRRRCPAVRAILAANWKSLLACAILTAIAAALYATFRDKPVGLDGLPMRWQGWFTLYVVALTLVLLMGNLFGNPGLAFLFALLLLTVTKAVPPEDAFSGFGSDLVIAIALLYVVSAAVRESTLLNYVVHYVLGRPTTLRGALCRLVPPVMLASAFMSVEILRNTFIFHRARCVALQLRPGSSFLRSALAML